MNYINKIIIKIIEIYKMLISPFLGNNCRFHPTCSSYTIKSFERFNFLKAFKLSLIRVLKCNPFFNGGVDKVPKEEKD